MIIFVATAKHTYTHESVRSESPLDVRIASYYELDASAEKLPHATYVFTDVDRLPADAVMQAAVYYRGLERHGQKVLNDPARIRTRFGLLRALHRAGINDFDAYRVEDMEVPKRWPVFLRLEGNHSKPLSGLLHNADELEQALEENLRKGSPRSAMLIVEYAAEPVRPGLYRKLSVFRVGEQFLGYTCVHDDQWVVKIGKPGIAPPDLYDEEYDLVANNPYAEAMRDVFDIAGVDYGRVDFGLVGGRPEVYEINTNPDVQLSPKPGPVERRNQSVELFRSNYLAALEAIDSPPPPIVAEAEKAAGA